MMVEATKMVFVEKFMDPLFQFLYYFSGKLTLKHLIKYCGNFASCPNYFENFTLFQVNLACEITT